MAITSEIRIIPASRLTRLATAIARWSRRGSVPADAAHDHAQRRDALEDRLRIDRELQAWKRELDRSNALQRLYRGV